MDACSWVLLSQAKPEPINFKYNVSLDLKWGSYELVKHYDIESTYTDRKLHHRYLIEDGVIRPLRLCRGHTGHAFCLQLFVEEPHTFDCWICKAVKDPS